MPRTTSGKEDNGQYEARMLRSLVQESKISELRRLCGEDENSPLKLQLVLRVNSDNGRRVGSKGK